MKKILLISLLAVGISNTTMAQSAGAVISDKAGWHRIADRHASYNADRDEVMVVGNRHFKQIKLKVKDAPVNLVSYEVYYGKDSKKTIEVNKVLQAGEETAATDIDNMQPVTKVVLNYNTVGAKTTIVTSESTTRSGKIEREKEKEKETEKERAEVEIWGLK